MWRSYEWFVWYVSRRTGGKEFKGYLYLPQKLDLCSWKKKNVYEAVINVLANTGDPCQ
jgi:hypothetical protein